MYYFWLALTFVLVYYKLCNLQTDFYDTVVVSAAFTFFVSLLDVRMFLCCIVFVAVTALLHVLNAITSFSRRFFHAKGKCILVCGAGENVFVALHDGKVEVAASLAEKNYVAGEVVSVEGYAPREDIAIRFL